MQVSSDGSVLKFRLGLVGLSLYCAEEGVWRVLSEKNGEPDFFGAAQTAAADLGETLCECRLPLSIKSGAGAVTAVSPGGGSVKITNCFINFYDEKKRLRRSIEAVKKHGASFSVTVPLEKGERIFGTGERFNRVNQKGKRVHIYAIDKWCQTEGNSYLPVPFAFSSNCTALFFNRYEHSVFDIGRSCPGKLWVLQKNAPVDLYVFIKDDPCSILSAYSRLTGFASMPPEWSFGTLVCRYHPEFSTKQGIISMAEEMRKNDFPWDAVITEGWRTYDRAKWDELKEVSEEIHRLGKKMMVYQQCGRFPANADEDFGLDDSLAVQSDEGAWLGETRSMNLLDNFHHKKMRCVDLTDERSVNEWMRIWNELIHDVGVDGAKIDFCEQFPDKKGIRFADGRDPLAAHHWYPTVYNTLMFRKFNERPEGGVNFTRGGGIGMQRCPFVWAGDQRREFYFLPVVIRAALSLGLSGVPFVSWDMAGYRPSFNPADKLCENRVFMRAVEFTCFSPCVQTHGSVKRPYDFDSHTRDVYRAYTKLHEALRPYLVSQAEFSCKTGMPMMRHLFLFDCRDENCLDIQDEYMLGGDILVAPVLDRKTKRDIYLPKGEWIDIFTGKEFIGGRTLRGFKAELEKIPVFRLKNCSDMLLQVLENCTGLIDQINGL